MEVTYQHGRFKVKLSDGDRVLAKVTISEYGDLRGLSILSPLQLAEVKRRVQELIRDEGRSGADTGTPREVFLSQMSIWARLP